MKELTFSELISCEVGSTFLFKSTEEAEVFHATLLSLSKDDHGQVTSAVVSLSSVFCNRYIGTKDIVAIRPRTGVYDMSCTLVTELISTLKDNTSDIKVIVNPYTGLYAFDLGNGFGNALSFESAKTLLDFLHLMNYDLSGVSPEVITCLTTKVGA